MREKTTVWGQPRQKISKTPILTNKLGMVVRASDSLHVGDLGRRITGWDWPEQKVSDSIRNTKAKKD
jgi:hypothetical protein